MNMVRHNHIVAEPVAVAVEVKERLFDNICDGMIF